MEVSGKRIAESEDDLICLPCHLDGLKEQAFGYCQNCQEHLCKTCFKHHRRLRPTRNHVLLDKNKMPKTHTETTVKSGDKTEFCSKHTDKRLKFYCSKHKAIACFVCITLSHRNCEIEYIPDISGNMPERKEYTSLMIELRVLKEKCETRIKQIEEANKQIDQDHAIVIEEIKLFRKQVNECLDKIEEEITEKVESLVREEKYKITTVKEVCREIISELNEREGSLVNLKNDSHLNQLFIEIKQSEEPVLLLKNKEAKMQEGYEIHGSIKFTQNLRMIDLLNAENFGKVVLIDAGKTSGKEDAQETERMESEQFRELSEDRPVILEMTGTINVTSQTDKEECDIDGIVILPPEKIIVADINNKSIKLIDTERNTIVSQIRLSSVPFDIISLPQNKLAVALPNENCIQILCHSGSSLSTDRRFGVRESCRCLAYCNNKLIVACSGPFGKLNILNLKGIVLKNFESPDLSSCPEKVVVSKDKNYIFTSDCDFSMFIKTDLEGIVLKMFSKNIYKGPVGIQEIDDGTFLVCYKQSNNIARLSSNCRECELRAIENDNLVQPQAIAYCEKQRKLYVSCATANGQACNKIKVFDVKWQ